MNGSRERRPAAGTLSGHHHAAYLHMFPAGLVCSRAQTRTQFSHAVRALLLDQFPTARAKSEAKTWAIPVPRLLISSLSMSLSCCVNRSSSVWERKLPAELPPALIMNDASLWHYLRFVLTLIICWAENAGPFLAYQSIFIVLTSDIHFE